MILVADIGNTDTKLAIFSPEGKLQAETRLASDTRFDFSFYEQKLAKFLAVKCTKTVLASVVPDLTETFVELLSPHTDDLHITSVDSPWGFKIATEAPEKTGQDRLANMEGALRYGSFAIVIDAGTATKFDVLEAAHQKQFPGGAIAPGVGISFSALVAKAAQLKSIELDKHSPVVGYNTETAVRSGVLYGFAAMVDGMVMRIFEERKLPPNTVVLATGGYSRFLQSRARLITHVVPHHTLEGLYAIAKKL